MRWAASNVAHTEPTTVGEGWSAVGEGWSAVGEGEIGCVFA